MSYEHKTSTYTEYNPLDFEANIDPDNNFFNNININTKYYTDSQFTNTFRKSEGLSIIHFNARSLKANLNKINYYLEGLPHKFDIIAISESCIKDNTSKEFNLDGYDVHHVVRKTDKSGGTSIYVNSSLEYKSVDVLSYSIDQVFECVTVEVVLKEQKNVLVTCLYRKCGTDIEIFNNNLSDFFNKGILKSKQHFMCGDFNIDLLKLEQNVKTSAFIDLMYTHGFVPLITKPSRITSETSTLIDNIFTTDIANCKNFKCGLLINDITDHLPVFVVCNKPIKRTTTTQFRYKRSINDQSIAELNQDLLNQNWEEVTYTQDVNLAYANFVNKFNIAFNRNCPIKRYKVKPPENSKPWFNSGLKNACAKKNLLYKRFLTCKTKRSEDIYKRYKNKLTNILRQSEKDYYNKVLSYHKNDIKATWKVLNKLINSKCSNSGLPNSFTHNDKVISDKKEIANGFNNFFVNVGPSLAGKITPPESGNVNDYLKGEYINSMFLKEVNECELIQVVKKFKPKKSTDYMDISMYLVKEIIYSIAQPLTLICNKSFEQGIFPDDFKVARVVPIFKSGNKELFTNYRPVSLLPQFSKILEKMFSGRLDSYLDKHNVLADNQYGFRSKRSTSHALLELIEKITNALDSKKHTVGVFIDLKKAFDTIDHEQLLKKLEHYGIRGKPLSWLSSYLKNRQQFVQIGDVASELLKVLCGVPQGSILGPVLFILYINDISNVSKLLEFIMFADDTNIFCSGDNIVELCDNVSSELTNLEKWFALNKLSLNLTKTNFMVFSNRKKQNDVTVSINNCKLDRVTNVKFLGVTIDEKLNWKEHISKIKGKLSKCIYVLYKVKDILNEKLLYGLYCSLFLPYINYCIEIWGTTYATNIKPLCILQKKAIRIVCKTGYREHTVPLFFKLKAIKFVDLVKLRVCTVMYKAKMGILPRNLLVLLDLETNRNRYNTKNSGKFLHKFVRTNQKKMCLSVCGIILFNELSVEISNSGNVKQFVKNYKRFLINKYTM